MLKRLPRILIALALAGSIGLHWAVLQVVAWTGMVVSYAQGAPLTEAVAKTFDGNHPCALCKQIAKAQHAEKKAEYKFELSKFEFPGLREELYLCPPTAFWEYRAFDDGSDPLTHAPPVPPPRASAG